jgi:aminomethyltransferase
VDRVITRDATKLTVGRVYYTPWCDEFGKVIDDGTVHHLDDGSFRWTAADPQSAGCTLNAAGLDVDDRRRDRAGRRPRLQGPFSRAVLEAAAESRSRTCATSAAAKAAVAGVASTSRAPGTRATWATSCGSRRGR